MIRFENGFAICTILIKVFCGDSSLPRKLFDGSDVTGAIHLAKVLSPLRGSDCLDRIPASVDPSRSIDFDKYTVNAFLTGWVRDKNEAFSKTSWLRVQSKFVPTPLQRLVSQGPFALLFTGFSVRRCDQNNSSHKVSSTFSSL